MFEEKKEWRDTTAAHLALLEPENVARRVEIAQRMLKDGASHGSILEATRAATGTAIGGGGLTRLRRKIRLEAEKAERAEKRAKARAVQPAATKSEWVRLEATADLVGALVKARVAFVFDGQFISMKAVK